MAKTPSQTSGDTAPSLTDHAVNIIARGLLGLALILPYRWRVPFIGFLVSRVAAPIVGWHKRVRNNLNYIFPDMPEEEVKRLMREVPDNAGRTFIEFYSGEEFIDRVRDLPLEGPGASALAAARDAGKPVVLVTGHIGNYEVARAALFAQGYPMGALYRPLANQPFNARYVKALNRIGSPVFPATRDGIGALMKHMRDGGWLGILIDVYAGKGADLTFFGKPAPTALSAMEWALKFGAEVIPVYGLRKDNGLDFRIQLNTPIPHSDPETMTQELNDDLERVARDHMEQWFWIHRRWKPERQLARAAANKGP